MRWNLPLTWIASGFIFVNLLFALHASTMTGGTSLIYSAMVFPIFWGLTLIFVSFRAYKLRRVWFSKDFIISTFILLLFCTPIPLVAFTELTKPEMTRSGTDYWSKNGKTLKIETWVYEPGRVAIKKYWILHSENWLNTDESDFLRDSTWIYLDKAGDTLKTEKYKEDKLIVTRNYQE